MSLRILHTSDWHLGLHLHQESLQAEQQEFLNWLINTCIPQETPQVVLISGDVFDKTNPPTFARQMYYSFLAKLVNTSVKQVIITSGNHDSPALLDASKELLNLLNIQVIGNAPENPEECLVHVYDGSDNLQLVVAAVPFLRDQDIRFAQTEGEEHDREQLLRKGIYSYFEKAGRAAKKVAGNLPVVAMGHLFATNASISESERPIQLGNLAGIGSDCFPPELFDYVALGHIHRPQEVQNKANIWYSGSPIALSFSEWNQPKQVRMIEIESGKLESKAVPVPLFRKLMRLEGSFEEVKSKLNAFENKYPFPAFVEIQVLENTRQSSLGRELAQWVEELSKTRKDDFLILAYRFSFLENRKQLSAQTDKTNLDELKPEEVLLNLLNEEEMDEEERKNLLQVFFEICEMEGGEA
ncbi:MAG: exonuclease SbcCD subunit D C-terminal domain-containing protein [Bacteroidia bacterium]|nr:exonuclease SbcCD subunit D C-terminal domain-containing protein [Bacteroidia bacterium]